MAPSEIAVITINVDPTVQIGPLSLAWHGIMIAVGLAIGTVAAARYGRRRGLDRERVTNAAFLMAVSGIVGARFLYLVLNRPGALPRPDQWVGTNGYAIYGGVIVGTLAAAVYLRRGRLSLRYLDALAFGFPFGLAVGRIGDVINGEHYGPASTLPWAFRHPNPESTVPSHVLAYHDGGFYEMVLGLILIGVVMALRDRLRRPGALLWLVLGLYGVGRFLMFFYRSDSTSIGLGLNEAQLVSAGLVVAAGIGAWLSGRSAGGVPTGMPRTLGGSSAGPSARAP
jgi:phosphatidylglycerol:prolipoprotein diacylglycerol transferase